MDDMDDSLSANLIDALSTFSKTRLRETGMLELLAGPDVDELYDHIKEGRITAAEFDDISDPSLIWSAILKGFESTPIFTVSTTNMSADDVVHRLSDSYKRACGPLLCTAELLLEYFPHNAAILVSSLQKAFVSPIVLGHSNATSFLLHVAEDYKMYFPYTYTFCRRIGKSPNITLQDWKDTFFPPGGTVKDQDTGGGELNTSGIQDFSMDNWDMSGLEEGEDSDDDSHHMQPRIPAVRAKKSTTRMRKKNTPDAKTDHSSARARGVKNAGGSSALHLLQDHPADTSVDSFIEIQELVTSRHDDDDDGPYNNSRMSSPDRKSLGGRRGDDRASNNNNDSRRQSDVSLDLELSVAPDDEIRETVTLDELRAVFEQSLNVDDEFLAEKGKLSRNLKYNSDVPSMAEAVMRFHDTELSWDELKDLAAPYIKEPSESRMLASSFDSDTIDSEPITRARQGTVVQDAPPVDWDVGVPVPRKQSRKKLVATDNDEKLDKSKTDSVEKSANTFKSDWSNTRTHQSFLVDSIEIERKVNGDSKKTEKKQNNSSNATEQLSPYLSLPKQPPTMTIVQEGEFMFQEIDRDGDGVVSKIDLIKALKVNSPLAAKLNLSKNIRQEDGTRDEFMDLFHSMDKDGSADISIEEFTAFLKDRGEQENSGNRLEQGKSEASKPVVKKSVSKTINTKSAADSWALSVDDQLSPKKGSLAEPVRLSTTSEDILDRSSGALVVSKENKNVNKTPPRSGANQGNTWAQNKHFGGNEYSAVDSPVRDTVDKVKSPDKSKQVHSIPRPLAQRGVMSRSDSEGSFEEFDIAALTRHNDDIPDSVEKGRLVINPPQPKPRPVVAQSTSSSSPTPKAGTTAKKFLDMHKKSKADNTTVEVLEAGNATSLSNNRVEDMSKSVDFSIPRKDPLSMLRTKSENAASLRPPLPAKPSWSGIINSKIASFRIRGKEPSQDEEVAGVSPSTSYLPPPQTELGAVMGVVLEGWLEKKSSITGLFQKRYVVLAFGKASHMRGGLSSAGEDFMELRIFKRAVESAWGNAPIELKRVIALDSVESVEAHANKKKIDSIFTITERMLVSNEEGPSATDPTAIQSAGAASTSATGTSVTGNPSSDVITVTRHDSFDSVNSDFQWADKSRVITLRASSPETRLLWVTTLRKAMDVSPTSKVVQDN